MNVHTPLIPEKVLTSKENDNHTDLVLHHPLLPPPPLRSIRERSILAAMFYRNDHAQN